MITNSSYYESITTMYDRLYQPIGYIVGPAGGMSGTSFNTYADALAFQRRMFSGIEEPVQWGDPVC